MVSFLFLDALQLKGFFVLKEHGGAKIKQDVFSCTPDLCVGTPLSLLFNLLEEGVEEGVVVNLFGDSLLQTCISLLHGAGVSDKLS